MRTIAVLNQKGGSGKTTTAVCLGAALAERGRRVLLVDLDPQYSATTWLSTLPVGRGVFDLFADPRGTSLQAVARPTATPGLDLAGASAWLVGAEKALSAEPGAETILKEHVAALPAGAYDYLLIDCPPTLGVLSVNALTAAAEVLVPVECHVMGLQGLAQLAQTVELVRRRLNPALRIAGIVPCRLDARTNHGPEVVAKLRARFPETTATAVRENVRLAECPSMGEPITAYAPASAGAEDYRALAAEVMAREGGEGGRAANS
ncbi:MAG: ParA family protein [Gemmataceae bacterium]|nr:ParA family protein [Gemmataceae bacterium]